MTPAELRSLARDRPLVTRELHPFNAFYGHDAVLKAYAGLPPHRPLSVAIEHGVALSDAVGDIERDLRLPYYLCPASWRAEAFNRVARRGARAIPIGPLARYVPTPRPERSERTLLLVDAHSTHHFAASYDLDTFVRHALDRARAFDRVVACLYWADILAGRAAELERRGIEVVTAGHMYDPGFLPRLLSILASAAGVVTNEVGTHVVYAVLLGRPVEVVPQEVRYRLTSGDTRTLVDGDRRLADALRARFASPPTELSEEQRRFVEDVAGVEHVRSADELRSLLLEAEEEYRRRTPRSVRLAVKARATARWLHGTLRRRLAGSAAPGVASPPVTARTRGPRRRRAR